jgi:hypothetical protein
MANNFDLRKFLSGNKLTKNAQLLKEETSRSMRDKMNEGSDPGFDRLKQKYRGEIMDKGWSNPSLNKALEKDADYKKLKPSEQKKLKTYLQGIINSEYNEGVVKESALSSREKYLTRLVENALGLEGYGDDNVNKQREKQGLPPAQGPKYSEGVSGDEMVEEKPLPKYENIEKLMQEIDKSTDEEAHKFKIAEMKRVADMLEKKCTALEEGDDAEHIDQKKLKQMKKDIMTLRKNIEKLEKLGEKKFTKKETKTDLKETTMETTFDLKKFLTENKLTANSRMLKEDSDMGEKMQFFMEFMEQYAAGMPEADILEILEGSYDIPENIDMKVLERATSQLDLAINDIYTAIFESDNY